MQTWTVIKVGKVCNFYVQTRSNESEQEQIIFTVHELERALFTVHELEQTILPYAHFQDLMIYVWEMTDNEQQNIIH